MRLLPHLGTWKLERHESLFPRHKVTQIWFQGELCLVPTEVTYGFA